MSRENQTTNIEHAENVFIGGGSQPPNVAHHYHTGSVHNYAAGSYITQHHYAADGGNQPHMPARQNYDGTPVTDGAAGPAPQAGGRQQAQMHAGQNSRGGSRMPGGPSSASRSGDGRQQPRMQARPNVHDGSLVTDGPSSGPGPQAAAATRRRDERQFRAPVPVEGSTDNTSAGRDPGRVDGISPPYRAEMTEPKTSFSEDNTAQSHGCAGGRQQSQMHAGQNSRGGSRMPGGPSSASRSADGRQQSQMQSGQSDPGRSLMSDGPSSANRPPPEGAPSAQQAAPSDEFNVVDLGLMIRRGLDPDN